MSGIGKPVNAPSDWDRLSDLEKLSLLPDDIQEEYLRKLIAQGVDLNKPPMELELRPTQWEVVTSEEWITLYSGGRGTGKTRTGASWTIKRAKENPGCIIHLVGRTAADVRDVIVGGEALALDTLIATADGYSTMGEIQVGDSVIGSDGNPHKVLWVSDIQINRPCYRVTFKDGESVVCDGNHKWTTWTHQARRFNNKTSKHQPRTISTLDIKDSLKFGNQLNHAILNIKPVCGSIQDLPIKPYTLGVWLGDGHSYHAAVTTMDCEVLDGIVADGYAVRKWVSSRDGGKAHTYGVLGLSSKLKSLNLIGNKYLPDIYLYSSIDQRLKLLQGLIDTDGCVDKDGEVHFYNTDYKLIQSVSSLLATLGIKSSIRSKPAGIYTSPTSSGYSKICYDIRFYTELDICTINRKRIRLSAPKSPESNFRYIKSIDDVDSVPVKCIAVDADDKLYAIGNTLVLTHNSGILNSSPDNFKPIYTPSLRKITWPNGTIGITFSASEGDQLRGPQSNFTWADELASYDPKPDVSGATAWDQIVMSTRLGDKPQILGTTTPRRTPIIKNLIKQAENTAKTHVKLVTGSTLDNRANLSEDYIRAIYDRYAGTHLERQELYGELSGDAEGALWRTQDFHYAQVPESVNLITVIGVDPSVGKGGGDDCGIIIASAENLGWSEVSKRKAWVREDLTAQMSPDEWTRVIIDAHNRYPGSVVAIESNQGFELLRFVIHQIDPTVPIALVNSRMNKAQRAEPIVMAFRQQRVFLVDQMQELVDEATTWEPNASRWSPGHIDAMSVALGTLLVDPRPLYPYLPAATYIPNDDDVRKLNVVPSWRQDHQTHSGLALPPWRR